MNEQNNLLSIKDLVVHYVTDEGTCKAVNGINLELKAGETLGLVGETGAGKTTIALSILNIVPNPPGKIIRGEIYFDGKCISKLSDSELREVRGKKISMIFQDPMTALNPTDSVGSQIAEVIRLHNNVSKAEAAARASEAMKMVGIPPERYNEYPHQFSGGMKQRILIAIALACTPELLIADEPTTALDVTIQAQVLEMINELKSKLGTSVLLITHDLGVVAEMCDRVAIIYAGEIVEIGNLEDIYDKYQHSYTRGLFGSLPSISGNAKRLTPIGGLMPDPTDLPKGCKFAPRCSNRKDKCAEVVPELKEVSTGHFVRCLFAKKAEKGGI